MPDRSRGWHRYLFMREIEWQRKKSLVYYCTECGTESAKWQGQCPGCGAWNTMEEAPVTKTSTGKEKVIMPSELAKPTKMREIETENTPRLQTGIQELDRVLGGGIVAGSLVLVGGDPGIGKSTLLLQMCKHLSDKQEKVLYVSGEESLQQIKLRGDRIGEFSDSIFLWQRPILRRSKGRLISCSRKWRSLTRFRPCTTMRLMRHREA